jgi:phage repressor protein C with HTH and peptisase S24 domain
MSRSKESSHPTSQPENQAARQADDRAGDRAGFVARLRVILGHWPSADRLARAVGVSPSAFRKWLRGEAEPSRERLVALADAAGVNVAWLAKGEGPEPHFPASTTNAHLVGGRHHGLNPRQFVILPKRSVAAAAGAATPAPPSLQSEFIAFGHDWIRSTLGVSPDDLVLESAVGESMHPTIHDNDLLLIDSSDTKLREFGIYVLEYQGERLVKRVQRKLDGGLVLISDNAIYEAERIPPERAGDVKVIGRVVWSGGRI